MFFFSFFFFFHKVVMDFCLGKLLNTVKGIRALYCSCYKTTLGKKSEDKTTLGNKSKDFCIYQITTKYLVTLTPYHTGLNRI